jgi:hypothetical protein
MKSSYRLDAYHWEDRTGDGRLIYSAYAGENWCYVHRLGSSWGYTLWCNGRCLGGAQDWNWTFNDTLYKAEEALLQLCGRGEE